jgi:integrase
MRGQGRIFLRGSIWWIGYFLNGKEFRESTGSTDGKEATKFLSKRLKEVGAAQIGAQEFVTPQSRRLTLHNLLEAVRQDLELRSKLSSQSRSSLLRADRDFGSVRALALTAEKVDSYIEGRLVRGDAKASINRITQHVVRAYHLAMKRGHLNRMPAIRHLDESDNVRQGFLSRVEFDKLLIHLPEDLKDFCLFAFLTGMRLKEIKSLRWKDMTDDHGKTVVRLLGKNAKTKKPRMIVAAGELAPLLERRREARAVKTPNGVTMAALIFHRDGERVGEFRKSWKTACVAAGVGKWVCRKCGSEGAEKECPTCETVRTYAGTIFHDTRRCGVRNLRRAGNSETVCMAITGHTSRSTFDRYNLTDEADLEQAMLNVQQYHEHETQQKVVAIGGSR